MDQVRLRSQEYFIVLMASTPAPRLMPLASNFIIMLITYVTNNPTD